MSRILRKGILVLAGFAASGALVFFVGQPAGAALSEAIASTRVPEGFELIGAFFRNYGEPYCQAALCAACIVTGWFTVALVASKVLGWRDASQ